MMPSTAKMLLVIPIRRRSVLEFSKAIGRRLHPIPFPPPPLPRVHRLSVRYLKSLLRSLCRVTEDGKRLLFEYRRRLATWGRGAVSRGSDPQPKSTESSKAVAGNGGVPMTCTTENDISEPDGESGTIC